MKTNYGKAVTAAGGKLKIIHAAGATVEGCTAAFYALCGDNRGIRRMMRGYLETYAAVNCPSCLQKMKQEAK